PGVITTFVVPRILSPDPRPVDTVGDINDRGLVVGSTFGNFKLMTQTDGYIYDSSSTNTTLLVYPSSLNTQALGINNAGQVVGFADVSDQRHGFVYSGGTFMTIDGPLAQGRTEAHGINDSGQIVGNFYDGTSSHGFLYSGGNFTTL